ncbi:MAG: hypothetical protein LBH61_05775, partial [Dysgonamonadaceae bacterium]|nr:hypothetical protein [Dysgonamonadaceae bacterium]
AVRFAVEDPAGLLASYTTDNAAGTVTLTFKSLADIKTKVGEADRTHAKKITITASFLDNRGTKKKADLVVRVQNAPVGCSVRRVDDPEKTNPAINGWLTFMCYNLGADPDYSDPAKQKEYIPFPNTSGSTDHTVYGDLYQWGRAGDGHQRRDLAPENIWPSDHLGETSGFTEDPVPNNAANIDMTTYQILETDARFGKFIRRLSGTDAPADSNFDWIAGTTPVYNNRWNIGTEESPVKAPADPCPDGWRVPTHTEWASIYGTTTDCVSQIDCFDNAKVNKWDRDFAKPSGNSVTHGILLTPSGAAGNTAYDSSPTLFLPAGDDRNFDHATLNSNGATSTYWSSSVVAGDVSAYRLRSSSMSVCPSYIDYRSYGASVRCVSE